MLRLYIAPGYIGLFLAKFGLFWAILGYFRSKTAHGTQVRYIDAASVVRDHRFLNPQTTPGSKNDIIFPSRLRGVKLWQPQKNSHSKSEIAPLPDYWRGGP